MMGRVKKLPSLDRLRHIVDYEPATGEFVWKNKTSDLSRIMVGKIAGRTTSNGQIQVGIDGEHFPATRLAFLFMTGKEPLGEVRHVDGDRANNRWENLREIIAPQ